MYCGDGVWIRETTETEDGLNTLLHTFEGWNMRLSWEVVGGYGC